MRKRKVNKIPQASVQSTQPSPELKKWLIEEVKKTHEAMKKFDDEQIKTRSLKVWKL
jgi:uncharacterized protein YeaO (DUF488 family)